MEISLSLHMGMKRKFYILAEKEYVDIPFIPALNAKVVEETSNKKEAIVLDIKGGTLHLFTSYTVVSY